MKELVSFRGSHDGVKLILAPEVKSLAEIKAKVVQKLQFTPNFFKPDTKLLLEKCSLSPAEQLELFNLFAQYNLKLIIKASVFRGSSKDLKPIKQEGPVDDLVLNRTIRGGEEIAHNGNVVIYGNVNPSAKIIAAGNIIVHGICKGIIWAGAKGDTKAKVVADELAPSQIKIANIIAISPDNDNGGKINSPEEAIIKDGTILFKPCQQSS